MSGSRLGLDDPLESAANADGDTEDLLIKRIDVLILTFSHRWILVLFGYCCFDCGISTVLREDYMRNMKQKKSQDIRKMKDRRSN